MAEKRVFVLRDQGVAARLWEFLRAWPDQAKADRPLKVAISEYRTTRTLEQNARMWAMLTEVSDQVDWYGQKLTPAEWKDVFSAALKRQKVVPAIDGGFVVLGTSTSRMSVGEMSDLMELMSAFGAERGVHFFDTEQAA